MGDKINGHDVMPTYRAYNSTGELVEEKTYKSMMRNNEAERYEARRLERNG